MKKYLIKIIDFSLKFYSEHIKTFDPLLLTYFPFVGWFIPMIIKKDDEFYMYHAKQGFVFAVFFTGSCTFLYFFIYFISVHADVLKFVIVMMIYILYILYFAIFVIGTRMIRNMEKKDFPYLNSYIAKYTSMLNI